MTVAQRLRGLGRFLSVNSAGADRAPVGRTVYGIISILLLLLVALTSFALPQSTATLWLWPRWLAIMTLAWWLPGALLVRCWRLPKQDLPTLLVLATGLGWCWMILLLLLVHWLPGEIRLWPLLALYTGGNLALLVGCQWRNGEAVNATPKPIWLGLAVLLVLALLLRLPGLGYHEFHYDEVLVLTRAKEAIRGEDDALARHAKGPGEIAVATTVYRALSTANETQARLPFALASVISILALAVLGARLVSWPVGLIAGGLLAINGFALGLSRIVQYQPGMLLLSILAVLAAWEFMQWSEPRWLALAALFSAFGVVMHYEFALLAPLLVVLVGVGWQRGAARRATLVTLILTAGMAALLVAATYVPIYLNAFFAETRSYLSTRLGSASVWNGSFFVEMGTFYNSIYFFVGLLILTGAGLLWGWRFARWPTLLLTLWFLPFLLLYLFVVQFPGTHFYLLMPSWSLLAALPLPFAFQQKPSFVRWGAVGFTLLWLGVSIPYLHLLFFRQSPEYLVNYQSERIPFYWAPYGKNIPEKPRFGFPIQAGWKTLGVLAEWKYLGQTYASNERSRHLRWYLGAFERVDFDDGPDFILVARHLQEPDPAYNEARLAAYQRVGEVHVRGEPRIELWAHQPLAGGYVIYDAESFAPLFDGVVPPLRDLPQPAPQVLDQPLDERITLAATVDRTTLAPGDLLHLHLDWLPRQPLTQDYKLFVHVADDAGQPLAQWDGLPGLNTARTSGWPVGEVFADHVLLRLPADVAPGEYRLLVGLYDPASGERIGGRAITVGTIKIGQR